MGDAEPYVGTITGKAILFGPDERVLLTRVGDHWEPPGGTFEYGETLVGGLRRELREEAGLDARVGPPVEALYGGWADDDGRPMVTLVYRCVTGDDPPFAALADPYEGTDVATISTRLRPTVLPDFPPLAATLRALPDAAELVGVVFCVELLVALGTGEPLVRVFLDLSRSQTLLCRLHTR